jgi:hypothetical protein
MFFWTPQKPERNGRTKFTGSCGVALGSIIIVKPFGTSQKEVSKKPNGV